MQTLPRCVLCGGRGDASGVLWASLHTNPISVHSWQLPGRQAATYGEWKCDDGDRCHASGRAKPFGLFSKKRSDARFGGDCSDSNKPDVRGAGAGSIAADLRTGARQQRWPERAAAWERSPGCVYVLLPPQCVCLTCSPLICPPLPPSPCRESGDVEGHTRRL